LRPLSLQHGFDVFAGLRLLDFKLVAVRPGVNLALSAAAPLSASAALSSAPMTTPSPTMKKKMSAIITPARLP